MVKKGLVFYWDMKSGTLTILNPDNWQPFFIIHLKSGQNLPDFECSGFQMVRTKTLAIARFTPAKIYTFKSTVGIRIPYLSDGKSVSDWQMFKFQAVI